MSFIVPQTKVENAEEMIILEKNITQQKPKGSGGLEMEEVSLPPEKVNLESVLPMIDYTEISNVKIVEQRKCIVKRKVNIKFKSDCANKPNQ